MSKQKIVDILGIVVLLGCIPWYWAVTQDLWLGLCIEIGMLFIALIIPMVLYIVIVN